MMTTPAKMRCRPKNTADQSVLMQICNPQSAMATTLPSYMPTRAAATDIDR